MSLDPSLASRFDNRMPTPEPVPTGLILFAPDKSPSYRRRRLIFVGILGLAVAAVIWPLLPFMAGPRPFILGLPLSLAWVLLWLVVVFGGLVWLYVTEPEEPAEASALGAQDSTDHHSTDAG